MIAYDMDGTYYNAMTGKEFFQFGLRHVGGIVADI